MEKVEVELDPSFMETTPREKLSEEGVHPILAVVLGKLTRLRVRRIVEEHRNDPEEVKDVMTNTLSNLLIEYTKQISVTKGVNFLLTFLLLLPS